jgi:spore coat protein A
MVNVPASFRLAALCAAFVLCMLTAPARAVETVVLTPAADNTLYEGDGISNGSGEGIFSGRNAQPLDSRRRALVRFDLSTIPPGSTIQSASLRLVVAQARSGSHATGAHRVLQSWGEGASIAEGGGGAGALALPGDATWNHRFFDGTLWLTPGGTFEATASATTSVGASGEFTWSGGAMATDVQSWVDNPATNFGWLLRGNESTTATARRFHSRESASIASRPRLTVQFTPPASFGACCIASGECRVTDAAACATLGGTFQGSGTSCTPNPCAQPPGACCFANGSCQSLSQAECAAQQGTFQGAGTSCATAQCRIQLTPFVDALPVPAIATPTTGTSGGEATYTLAMREFSHRFHRDLPLSRVWGYDAKYPGPTIVARRDLPVTVTWVNDLRTAQGQLLGQHPLPIDTCLHGPDQTGTAPVAIVHLHGGVIASEFDGQPELAFPPGQQSPPYVYTNPQRAATLWYHDHALGITGPNVYMGLAGAYIVRDAVDDALTLPRGEFDVPLIIQDRSFNADGSLRYDQHDGHFFGEFVTVNGKVAPFMLVKQGKYRFRIVNGANSRTFALSLSNGALFQQIASDQGLLAGPVTLDTLVVQPGERAEVIFDFASYPATEEITLVNGAPAPYPGEAGVGVVRDVMRFIVRASPGFTQPLPATLASVARVPPEAATTTRDMVLRRTAMDPCGNGGVWTINDLLWDDMVEFPRIGTTEVWRWINRSDVAHPMHMHLVDFQILDRQPFEVVNGVVTPIGSPKAPSPNELGWKDTVRVDALEIVRVIATFDQFAGRFPYHCHILEHEDHEMMRQFEVACTAPAIAPGTPSQSACAGQNAILAMGVSGDALSYSWRRDGLPLANGPTGTGSIVSGAGSANLVIANVGPADGATYDCVAINPCGQATASVRLLLRAPGSCPGTCDSVDFNGDGLFPDLLDVIDFFEVFSGGDCPPCADIDYNNDGVYPDLQDVVKYLDVLAGGAC